MVAIIKVGLTAASESGGHKGNKTREIRGQLLVVKVKCQCDDIMLNSRTRRDHFKSF